MKTAEHYHEQVPKQGGLGELRSNAARGRGQSLLSMIALFTTHHLSHVKENDILWQRKVCMG